MSKKALGAGAAAVVVACSLVPTQLAHDEDTALVTDEKILSALQRSKYELRLRALATAQAIAWSAVLTPDQREDCIRQAIQ